MLAGHRLTPERLDPFRGLGLHTLLSATYAILCEGKSSDEIVEMDRRLGLEEEEVISAEVEAAPRAAADPVALAMIAQFGDEGEG